MHVEAIAMREHSKALLVFSAVLASLCWPGGSALAQADSGDWAITRRTVLKDGRPANSYIGRVVRELAQRSGPGVPVAQEELLRYCDRALSTAYKDQLLKYATPRSIAIQRQEHADYSRVFMKESRQRAGVKFLHDKDRLLRAAATRYGVARHDIVSILMWESGLGEFVGDYRVFNILLGQLLYLDEAREVASAELESEDSYDPARWQSVEEQKQRLAKLKNRAVGNFVALLRLSKQKNVDPTAQLGSWGGALGYAQFMPASLVYAADGDGDGDIDLSTWPDAIFSVASYLEQHGYSQKWEGRKRGIHAYNPISSYVDGVIRYADAIWRRYQAGE